MDEALEARLVAGRGLEKNANQGGKRQVTLIEQEVWDQLAEQLGSNLDPSMRRANLLVAGVRLRDFRQRVLQIGDCRLRMWGEVKPCRRMEEAYPGLQGALYPDWKGGAYGEVLEGGMIRVGDSVEWVED